MVNTAELKNTMAAQSVTAEELAAIIKVDISTFYRKLKTGNFFVREAGLIAERLNLQPSAACAIFFAKVVA